VAHPLPSFAFAGVAIPNDKESNSSQTFLVFFRKEINQGKP